MSTTAKDILSLRRWQIVLTTNMARSTIPKINGISSAGGSQGTPRSGSNSRAISRHLGTTWATVRKPPIQVTKPAALTPLRKREVPQLQQGLPGTASLPPRLRPQGGPTGGGSSVVLTRSLPTQHLPPCRATSAMRWVTLVTFSIVT